MLRDRVSVGNLLAVMATGTLAACSQSEPTPVVEQIIVREPGAPVSAAAANATMAKASSANGTGSVDLVTLGEDAFQACTGCHNADKGGANMAGPNLHGVIGRKAGAVADYSYSDALSGSGITWDRASLDRFLGNPAGYVPGTDMIAGGVADGERRAAIVAYLASTSQ